ncbi:hypothetical protein AB1E18_007798 [Capra hircus]
MSQTRDPPSERLLAGRARARQHGTLELRGFQRPVLSLPEPEKNKKVGGSHTRTPVSTQSASLSTPAVKDAVSKKNTKRGGGMVVRPLPTGIQLAQQGRVGTHLRPSPRQAEIPKDLGWGQEVSGTAGPGLKALAQLRAGLHLASTGNSPRPSAPSAPRCPLTERRRHAPHCLRSPGGSRCPPPPVRPLPHRPHPVTSAALHSFLFDTSTRYSSVCVLPPP